MSVAKKDYQKRAGKAMPKTHKNECSEHKNYKK